MKSKIVLINHNTGHQAKTFIEKSDYHYLSPTEIIIVSNGEPLQSSIKNSIDAALSKKNIKFRELQVKNEGYAAAINLFTDSSQSRLVDEEFIFFSNCDLILKKAEENFDNNYNECDILGFWVYQKGRAVFGEIDEFSPLIPTRIRTHINRKVRSGQVAGVHGGFFGVSKEFLKSNREILPEKYFMYWDELDAFYRYKKNGNTIFLSKALIVEHDGQKSIGSIDARYYMLRNGLHFYVYVMNSKTMAIAWLLINTIYRVVVNREAGWYFEGIRDFLKSSLGPRRT
jgi:GT2 family glycosyltransferase